jgi:hypothetical protein
MTGSRAVPEHLHAGQQARPGVHRLAGHVALHFYQLPTHHRPGRPVARRDGFCQGEPRLAQRRAHGLDGGEPGGLQPGPVDPDDHVPAAGAEPEIEARRAPQVNRVAGPRQAVPAPEVVQQPRTRDRAFGDHHARAGAPAGVILRPGTFMSMGALWHVR